MPQQITLIPIGVVHSPIREPADDVWGITSRIELDPARFTPDALTGLGEFSHVEIVFLLHQVSESRICFGTRHPRGRTDFPKTGIFAQRGRDRPNRLGTTICRLLSVKGLSLAVEGLDAIDGTPVLDIKPYMIEFGPKGPVRQPGWATKLMSTYWNQPC